MSVITPSPFNQVPRIIQKALDRGALRGATAGESAERGTAEYQEMLVKYALTERKCLHNYWDWVEENYRLDAVMKSASKERLERISEVQKGRIYSFIHTLEAMIFNRRPKALFKPFWGAKQGQADAAQAIVNNDWHSENKLMKEIRLAVLDAPKYGIGIARTDYLQRENLRPFDPEKQAREARRIAEEAASDPVAQSIGDIVSEDTVAELSNLPPDDEVMSFEQHDHRVQGDTTSRRVSPRQYYVDPDAKTYEARFFEGEFVVVNLEAIRNNQLFKNVDQLQPSSAGAFRELGLRSKENCPYRKVILCDTWEKVPGEGWVQRIHAWQQTNAGILYENANPYWTGSPFRVLTWNEDGECIWPGSDLVQFHSEVLAEREVFTRHVRKVASEQPVTFMNADQGFSKKTIQEIYDDPAAGLYAFLRGIDPGTPLSQFFHTIHKPGTSAESLATLQFIDNSILVGTGLGPNQVGQAIRSGTSATEASNIQSFAMARSSHKRGAVEEFVANIAYDRLACYAQFHHGDAQWAVRFVPPELAARWGSIPWTRGLVQRGMSVIVQIGSMAPQDDASMRQTLLGILTVAAQFPAMLAMLNIPEFMIRVLQTAGIPKDTDLLLERDPEKVAQALALQGLLENEGGASPQGNIGVPPSQPSGEAGRAQTDRESVSA